MSFKPRQVYLARRIAIPKRGIWSIDEPGVGYDPLAVKRSEAVTRGLDDSLLIILHRLSTMLMTLKTCR